MNNHDGIAVIGGNILDEVVAEGIGQCFPVKTFGSIGIDENDRSISVYVGRRRILGVEIPSKDTSIFGNALLDGLEGTDNIRR